MTTLVSLYYTSDSALIPDRSPNSRLIRVQRPGTWSSSLLPDLQTHLTRLDFIGRYRPVFDRDVIGQGKLGRSRVMRSLMWATGVSKWVCMARICCSNAAIRTIMHHTLD